MSKLKHKHEHGYEHKHEHKHGYKSINSTGVFLTPVDRERFTKILHFGQKVMIKATKNMQVGDAVLMYLKREDFYFPGVYGYGVITKLDNGQAEITVVRIRQDTPLIHLDRLKQYTKCVNIACEIKHNTKKLLNNMT